MRSMARPKSNGTKDSSAHLGFEAKLWRAADKLRNNMDAATFANLRLYDSDTAPRASAFLLAGGKLQVMTERQDNFRKDDDLRWQF
jgi:hypothetical protein